MSVRKHEILSGLFIVAAAAIFGLLAFSGRGGILRALFGESLTLVAHFDDIKTLDVGAPVKVGGRKVGEVSEIGLSAADDPADSPRVRVTFFLDGTGNLSVDPGRKGRSRVQLAQDGLLGRHYLRLMPGAGGASAKSVNAWIEATGNDAPPPEVEVLGEGGLAGLIREAGPMIEDVRAILAALRTSVSEEGDVAKILENIREGTAEARSAMARIDALLDPENPDGLNRQILAPTGALVRNADESLSRLDTRIDGIAGDVRTLLETGNSTLAEAGRAMARAVAVLDEADPKVQRILEGLGRASGRLETRLDAVEEELSALLDESRGMVREARPELVSSLRHLRRTLLQAEYAVTKLRANPAVLLWGDSERIYDLGPTDETRLREAGKASPYGQREER